MFVARLVVVWLQKTYGSKTQKPDPNDVEMSSVGPPGDPQNILKEMRAKYDFDWLSRGLLQVSSITSCVSDFSSCSTNDFLISDTFLARMYIIILLKLILFAYFKGFQACSGSLRPPSHTTLAILPHYTVTMSMVSTTLK